MPNYLYYSMVNFKVRWKAVDVHCCQVTIHADLASTAKSVLTTKIVILTFFPFYDKGGNRNLPKGYLQAMIECVLDLLKNNMGHDIYIYPLVGKIRLTKEETLYNMVT